ncbi:MAG: IPT/TIG domain-containing protein, partial [Chloroflexi bacterium]|nr:IPT/TIG domain-containing protein [Chloroflexota bacterium]
MAAPVAITELGVFDSGGDGLAQPITARLYNRDTQAQVAGLTFAAGQTGTLRGGSRFLPLPTAVTLPVGFHGAIVAENYGPNEPNGNVGPGIPLWTTDGGWGALTFGNHARYGDNPGVFPGSIDGGVGNQYAAGTFTFIPALEPPPNPAPSLTAISPQSAEAGSPAFTLTVTGSGFVAASTIRWNGADRQTAYVSATQLTVQITSADLATAGGAGVTVFTPARGGGMSSAQTFTIAALAGKALQGAGSAPMLALPDGMLTATSIMTGELWFQTTGSGVLWGVQGSTYPNSTPTYVPVLYVGQDGKLRGEFWMGAATPITAAAPVNDGQWHHAALVADGNTQSLSLDGALAGTLAGGLQHPVMPYHQLGSGVTTGWPSGGTGWSSFTGKIDEARFWTEARTAQQIVTARRQKLSGANAGLAGYWRMDEGTGATVADASGHGKTGTLWSSPAPAWANSGAGLTSDQSGQTPVPPAPTLISRSPAASPAGSNGLTLTVTGANFLASAQVRWNGNALPTARVTSGLLTATVAAANIANVGAANITVATPGGVSNALGFTINSPNSFTVNSTAAAGDAAPGNGVCATAAGVCTLRAAIQEANARGGAVITLPAGRYEHGDIYAAGESLPLNIQSPITLNGAGMNLTTVSGRNYNRVMAVSGGSVVINDLTITGGAGAHGGGVAGQDGAGIYVSGQDTHLTLNNVKFLGNNTPGYGAGLFNNGATVVINNSTFLSNTTSYYGAHGGGLAAVSGSTTVNNSLFQWNHADGGAGAYFSGGTHRIAGSTFLGNLGGGIQVEHAGLIMTNSTVSGNVSLGAETYGGGIQARYSTMTLLNNTITDNGAYFAGGVHSVVSDVTLVNNIIAFNRAMYEAYDNNCFFDQNPSAANNLSDDLTCNRADGFAVVSNMGLAPQADNGGPTPTHALLPGSPAVNSGAAATCADPLVGGMDQRGLARPQGGGCDIGAVELVPAPAPALTSLNPSSALSGAAGLTLTVNGGAFVGGSAVRWNGQDRSTAYVSATQLTAQLTAADLATGGAVPVTVFTGAPGGGLSGAVNFLVNNPTPVLASVSPTDTYANSSNPFTLTVTGGNFTAQSRVTWNGSVRITTFVSPTQLRATLSSADIGAAGTAAVAV